MSKSVNIVMGPFEWLLLGVLSLLWGGSFFFGKVAVVEMGPLTIVFCRVALAALVLHTILLARGQRMPVSPKLWGMFFVMGAINNLIPFSLIFWGQIQIASGLASILNATAPLWTVLLAHFLTTDERMTGNRLGGVICGLVGAVVMIGPDALSGIGLNVLAQFAILGAALSYAFAGIFGKRFKGIPPLVTATGQITATAVMSLPLMLLVDRPLALPLPSLSTWAAVTVLGLFCTALAYIIYFRLLASAGATNLLLVAFLIPVSALFLGMTILGERLDPRHFAGMILIGLGLTLIDGRLLTRLARLRWRATVQS